MSDESRLSEVQRLVDLLELDRDASQDISEARTACPLHEECLASGGNANLVLNWLQGRYRCNETGQEGPLSALIRLLEDGDRSAHLPVLHAEHLPADHFREPAPAALEEDTVPIDAEFTHVTQAVAPAYKAEPKVLQLKLEQRLPTPAEIAAAREAEQLARRQAQAERRTGRSERLIIGTLSLIFLLAGLAAAGLSAFANYQAFSATVADPLQGRIWGFAGVIAAIISFGGFTFVYWHGANRRMKEALQALIFALLGAGASVLGTEIYIRNNAEASASAVETASSNREILQSQITDWRRQLEGIPPETRSVEGLEAYLAEVERIGRTDQKPYRDARNELGLAKRRDDLIQRIEAANAELLGLGTGNVLLRAENRAALPGWLFAILLELFSSQATSIGFVALLLLANGQNRAAATAAQPGKG